MQNDNDEREHLSGANARSLWEDFPETGKTGSINGIIFHVNTERKSLLVTESWFAP